MRRPALSEEEIAEIEKWMNLAIDRIWPRDGRAFTIAERIDPEWRLAFGEELEENEALDAGLLNDGANIRSADPRLALAAARAHMGAGQPLSSDDAEIIQKALRRRNGRAKPVPPNYGRDQRMVELVDFAKECGLNLTRNPDFKDSSAGPVSACSMIARLLKERRGVHLSEGAIEKIVKRHRRLLR